jgi:protein-S-isoprenylcysteine O-methyltransferase Ste14
MSGRAAKTQFSSAGESRTTMIKRITSFLYGAACYAIFLVTFLYAIGFIGNLVDAKSIDSKPVSSFGNALLVDLLLLGVFAVQHSLMARQWFKRGLTRVISPQIERSTYVLFSSLALLLLFWKWQPMGGTIWNIGNLAGRVSMYVLYAFGWLTVLATTFLIDHFDLFGLRQVWLYLLGRPYLPLGFRTPGPYRRVRHPLYVGWIFVFWSTPVMTGTHLLFAVATTTYILVAIRFEERDLRRSHREYADYARCVPMIVPTLRRASLPANPRNAA